MVLVLSPLEIEMLEGKFNKDFISNNLSNNNIEPILYNLYTVTEDVYSTVKITNNELRLCGYENSIVLVYFKQESSLTVSKEIITDSGIGQLFLSSFIKDDHIYFTLDIIHDTIERLNVEFENLSIDTKEHVLELFVKSFELLYYKLNDYIKNDLLLQDINDIINYIMNNITLSGKNIYNYINNDIIYNSLTDDIIIRNRIHNYDIIITKISDKESYHHISILFNNFEDCNTHYPLLYPESINDIAKNDSNIRLALIYCIKVLYKLRNNILK